MHHLDSPEGAHWSQLRPGKFQPVLLLLYQLSAVPQYVSVIICKPCVTLHFLVGKALAVDSEKLPAEWTVDIGCKTDPENQALLQDTSWDSLSKAVLGILKTS